jgi:cobalt/nickel transport system permease protein
MGIVGVLGAYAVSKGLKAVLPARRWADVVSTAVGAWASVVFASAACALELAVSGTSPARVAFPAMVGTHVFIGIGEALITVAAFSAVAAVRPDILPGAASTGARRRGRRVWALAAAGLGVAVLLGALASPFASSFPDGLEKVAEKAGFLHRADGRPVWGSSPLPDYAVPGVKAEGLATGLAGAAGTAAVFAVGFLVLRLLRRRRARSGA